MAESNFTKLQVYQLAEELADRIWEIVIKWDYLAKRTVGEQIIRSADSISANIAEGAGRGSFQDNRRFALIARGSLYETKNWLRRSYKRNLLTEIETKKLKTITEELSPKLNAFISSLTNRSKNN
jgi:four helix bundle protein